MNKLRTEAAVGMMVTAGFLVLAFIVFGISGIYFFRPGYLLKAKFGFVGIIDRGAPVRYAGVKVGEVKKVEIIESGDSESSRVLITFFIVKGVKVYEGDKISIQGTHIMSEPHVAIEPTERKGRLLKSGDVAKGMDPILMDELIREGREIATKINNFLSGIQDSMPGAESKESMRQFLANMMELVASLNKITQGKEEELRLAFSNLSKSTDQMNLLLEKMNRGQGTLGRLIAEDEIYRDLRDFVQEIKKHPWRLLKR